MPRRQTHKTVGALSGLTYSAIKSKDQPGQLLEIIGGTFGGMVGGCLPDIIEPGFHPNHRSTAHSLVVGGSVAELAALISTWQEQLRNRANELVIEPATCPRNSLQAVALSLQEMACRMIAGFLAGIQAEYISHVALDACTPKGICLICRGF